MSSKNGHLREFGRFRLDAEKKVLWAGDRMIDQQMKVIELLCLLTERGGDIVTKNEILDRVWANAHVEESNLSQHIYRLRKMFREFGETRDLIQTVPRRGYRFVGDISGMTEGLIIERRSISKTVVEELDISQQPNRRGSFLPVPNSRLLVPVAVCVAVVAAVLAGLYGYSLNSAAAGQPIRSVAVLPLRSLDGDQPRSIGLGFADALITSLGRIDGVQIRSTNSVSRFADESVEPIATAKSLGVDAVVEGTLQRENGTLRATLRLIRMDGKQIWSGTFDRPENEVFALQDAIASATASALSLNVKQPNKRPTANLDAYQAYLQGQYFFRRRETSKAGQFYKNAVELDPRFAEAWAGLAAVYAMGDSMADAGATVDKAIELRPDLGEAHAVRGFIKTFLDWNWAEAEASLAKAIELDPNSVEAHHWMGSYLTIRSRFAEAETSLRKALELDPTSANLIADLGLVYMYSGRFADAEITFLKARAIDERFASYRLLDLFEVQGRADEALPLILHVECSQKNDACRNKLTRAFAQNGLIEVNKERLKERLALVYGAGSRGERDSSNWYALAQINAKLGNRDEGIRCLSNALESKVRYEVMNFSIPFVAADTSFASLRSDPRFFQLLKKINLL